MFTCGLLQEVSDPGVPAAREAGQGCQRQRPALGEVQTLTVLDLHFICLHFLVGLSFNHRFACLEFCGATGVIGEQRRPLWLRFGGRRLQYIPGHTEGQTAPLLAARIPGVHTPYPVHAQGSVPREPHHESVADDARGQQAQQGRPETGVEALPCPRALGLAPGHTHTTLHAGLTVRLSHHSGMDSACCQ